MQPVTRRMMRKTTRPAKSPNYIDKARQSLIGEIISVDDVDEILDEIFLLEHVPAIRSFRGAAALVHGSDES